MISIYEKASGRIISNAFISAALPEDDPTFGSVEGAHDGGTKFVENEKVRDRPSLSLPDEIQSEAAATIEMAGLPDGTVVCMGNLVFGPDGEGRTVFAVEPPGEYNLKVIPPFPYIESGIKLTVIAAPDSQVG